ncbi:MAG: hypothetical protein AAB296_07120 [Candidatus Desantisbacteria bacterium]
MSAQVAKKNIDLMNLAFIMKELAAKVQELDEDDLETLEIMLDDELMTDLSKHVDKKEYFTHEQVFGHPLS